MGGAFEQRDIPVGVAERPYFALREVGEYLAESPYLLRITAIRGGEASGKPAVAVGRRECPYDGRDPLPSGPGEHPLRHTRSDYRHRHSIPDETA